MGNYSNKNGTSAQAPIDPQILADCAPLTPRMSLKDLESIALCLSYLPILENRKSAHTALAVKACLLGGNSYTKCSITFVNIAVAISALAGGAQKRFRTETRIRWCFRHFSRIFGCLSARGYWNGILGHFGSFPAMEKRPKMKKHCP